MAFRIALGSMSCDSINSSDKIGLKIKDIIESKLKIFQTTDFQMLQKLSDYSYQDYTIEGKTVEVSFFKSELDPQRLLLVARAAYKTFNRPTYICWGFVGRVYSEGIIINDKNESTSAPDNLLLEFK